MAPADSTDPHSEARPRRPRRNRTRSWSLAQRVLLVQWIVLLVATTVAVVGSYAQTRATVFRNEGSNLVSIATLAVDEEEVTRAYSDQDSAARTKALSPVSKRIMEDTGSDFATFMNEHGDRLTYHRPGYVGTHYPGTLAPALEEGRGFTETSATATAGLSVRAVVPVKDQDSRVVGALTVGRTVNAVQLVAASKVPLTLAVALGIAALLGVVSWYQSRYLRRVTQGLGPEQLGQQFAAADAALTTVDEGIVITDGTGHVVFHNRAADALLGLHTPETALPDDGTRAGASRHGPRGRPLHRPRGRRRTAPQPREGVHPDGATPQELGLTGPLAQLIASGRRAEDEAHSIGGRVVVVRQQPLRGPLGQQRRRRRDESAAHRGQGWVLTVHDHTAVQRLSGELATTRSLTAALRAQNHDHANRLHTLLGLLEIGRSEEAHSMLRQSVGTPGTAAPESDGVDGDVVLAALLHGKIAEAAERGVVLESDVRLQRGTGLPPGDVVTVFGNLVDNALDAAAEAPSPEDRWVRVDVGTEEADPDDHTSGHDEDRPWLIASVSDGGAGFSAENEERLFAAGFSTKPAGAAGHGQGLAIVASVCSRLGGTVSAATDSGTVFTVELPIPRATPGAEEGGGA